MNYSEVSSIFKEHEEVEVVFTKVNGETRTLIATIKNIPEEHESGGSTVHNENVYRCFDLEKEAWRSFRLDSIVSIKGITDESSN